MLYLLYHVWPYFLCVALRLLFVEWNGRGVASRKGEGKGVFILYGFMGLVVKDVPSSDSPFSYGNQSLQI